MLTRSEILKPHIISSALISTILCLIYHRQWFLLRCIGFLLSICIYSLFGLWVIFFIAHTAFGQEVLNLLLLPTPTEENKPDDDDSDFISFWTSIFQNIEKKDIQQVIKAIKFFKYTHKSVIQLVMARLIPSNKKMQPKDIKKKSSATNANANLNNNEELDPFAQKETLKNKATNFSKSLPSSLPMPSKKKYDD